MDDDDDIIVEISNSSTSDENVSTGFVFPKKCSNIESLVVRSESNDRNTSVFNRTFKELKSKTQDKPVQVFSESFESPSWLVELRFQMNILFGKMLNTINFVEHYTAPNLQEIKALAKYDLKKETNNLKQIYDCSVEKNGLLPGQKSNTPHFNNFEKDLVSKNDLGKRLKEMLDIIKKIKSLVPVIEDSIPASRDDSSPSKIHKTTKNLEKYPQSFQNEANLSPSLDKNSHLNKKWDFTLKTSPLESKKFQLITNFAYADEDVQSERGTIYYDCKSHRNSPKCIVETSSSKNSPVTDSPHCVPCVLENSEFTVPKLKKNERKPKVFSPTQTKVVSSTFDSEPSGFLSNRPIKLSYDEILPNKSCQQTHKDKGESSQNLNSLHKKGNLNKESVSNTRYYAFNVNKDSDSLEPVSSQSCKVEHSKREEFDMPHYITAIKRIRERKPGTKREIDFSKNKSRNVKFDFMEYYTKVLDLRIKYDKLKRNKHSSKGIEDCSKTQSQNNEHIRGQRANLQEKSKESPDTIKNKETTSPKGNSQLNHLSEASITKNCEFKIKSESLIKPFQHNQTTQAANYAPCKLQSRQSTGTINTGLFAHSDSKTVEQADWQDKLYEEIKEYFEKMKRTETIIRQRSSSAKLNSEVSTSKNCTPKTRSDCFIEPFKHNRKTLVVNSVPRCISRKITETENTVTFSHSSNEKDSESRNGKKKETPTGTRQSFQNILHFISPFRMFKSDK